MKSFGACSIIMSDTQVCIRFWRFSSGNESSRSSCELIFGSSHAAHSKLTKLSMSPTVWGEVEAIAFECLLNALGHALKRYPTLLRRGKRFLTGFQICFDRFVIIGVRI